MKLPLSWIKEMIPLDQSPSQISTALTNAGLEVDALIPLPLNFEKVVVGEVLQAEKHPNAENLTLASVSDGKETYQIVCGAPNCRTGIKTAFALIGAKLQDENGNPFKIKKAKLRGVESFGMLCTEKELGLGDNANGIMEIPHHIPTGVDLASLYSDVILEISLTPNLGHCANVLGVARELSAATGVPVKYPQIVVKETSAMPIQEAASVKVQNQDKCPRYTCRVIKNVTLGPSPDWLQKRLLACDLRPVNNIVDVTNYVLLEMGQPLHAFDFNKVEKNAIVVRDAMAEERFLTLDGKEHVLSSEDLLICDGVKPIAIAGVMGGKNSEVSEGTTHILLESAYFEPKSIRRTSKRLGLQTDASKRFERGCDPKNTIRALDRAAELIELIAGGEVCQGVIDVHTITARNKIVTCRLSRINHLLGTQLSLSEVEAIFHKLEMGYAWDAIDRFIVKPPSYRVDVNEEVDLIEEIARIYGLDNIPKKVPRYSASTLPHSPIYLLKTSSAAD